MLYTLPSLTITAAAVIILATIPPASSGWLSYYHVHIINELDNAGSLLVHCHCTDHDIGEHYIVPGREFEWRFKEHIFRKTLWKCYLSPAPYNSRHVDFVAFDDFTVTFGNHVYWVAKEIGVFYRDADTLKDAFMFGWEHGRVPVS
ncbi:S-protein homolog 1 [Linum grandiflorum]